MRVFEYSVHSSTLAYQYSVLVVRQLTLLNPRGKQSCSNSGPQGGGKCIQEAHRIRGLISRKGFFRVHYLSVRITREEHCRVCRPLY